MLTGVRRLPLLPILPPLVTGPVPPSHGTLEGSRTAGAGAGEGLQGLLRAGGPAVAAS